MSRSSALLAVALGVFVSCFAGCTEAPVLTSIQLVPSNASLTSVGQTQQFRAIGSYNRTGGHPTQTNDISAQVSWASSDPSVASVSATGLATAVSTGSTTISATFRGAVGTTSLTVSPQAVHALSSIAVIPATSVQTVISIGEPTQFIAIGTYSSDPMTLDLTNVVTWQSSDVKVATINASGLALGNAAGTTTITAIGQSSTGAAIAATSTLAVTGAAGGVTLPQLSLYDVGLGAGTVTSIPVGIDCVSGAATGCTGNFVLGQAVTLTANPAAGSTFGGWSANCLPTASPTCTVTMSNNEPVGAIFN
jgi:trimeric autotransporter adhesin